MGSHGPAGRIRAPHTGGAGHPFCPVVVHGCAWHPDVGRGGAAWCQLLSGGGEASGVGRMFCDIKMPDGSPSYADPRFVLKRALGRAADLGFTFYTHPEVEFFLLKEKPAPGVKPQPIDSGGYFDHTPHSIAH